jgi:hypothetical protein
MDDSWKSYISSFLLTAALLGNLAGAVDLEYISPEKQDALAKQFSSAHMTLADKKQLEHEWTCDMYGMRTHLQVQHGLKLYDFRERDGGGLKNVGAQPVESYSFSADGRLQGQTERVFDRVRLTAQGELIGQLSLNAPGQTLIAYSVCKSL